MIKNIPPPYPQQVNQKKVNFTILELLQKGHSPSKIAKKLKCSKAYISKLLAPYKQDGTIKKIGYGVWKVDQNKLTNHTISLPPYPPHKLTNLVNFGDTKRGHAFQFSIKIDKASPHYEKREANLKDKGYAPRPIPQGIAFSLEGFKVWLCKQTVVINFPRNASFFSPFSAKDTAIQAINVFREKISQIEAILGMKLTLDGMYVFKITKSHFSRVKDALAIHCERLGKKVQVRGTDGKVWFVIDNSFNLHESETVHAKTSRQDMDDIIDPFMQSLKETKLTMSDILRIQGNTAQTVDIIAQQLKVITTPPNGNGVDQGRAEYIG